MHFATSGIEVLPLAPCAWAFAISFFCSMAGISGAFLLLPYQISVLGYTSAGVSATNQIFNILACPAGVFRYWREGRMLWPLAAIIAAGTLPGVFMGAVLRVYLLPDPHKFMFFVAAVLFYLGARMLKAKSAGEKAAPLRLLAVGVRGFSFALGCKIHQVKTAPLVVLSFVVGIIGGIYGVGGGAIMSPFLVSAFGLPIYAIAGATLFATFLASVAGVAFFSFLAAFSDLAYAQPDWALGAVLGIGGIFGMYCGAALQKYVPPRILRLLLLCVIFYLGFYYLFKAMA